MNTFTLPPALTLTVMIALIVIITDRVWRISAQVHPLTLYRLLVINLAKKVRPTASSPALQHYISGSLGILVLTVPFLIVLALIISVAYYQWFFDAVILFICLNFYPVRRQYKSVIAALSNNKKILARERLNQLVARQTTRLSDIGIAKAAIEAYLLRFLQQFIGVLFWYFLLGPLAALSYRLLLEFRWQWHRKNIGNKYFSLPAYWLTQCLIVPPYCVGAILLVLCTSPLDAIRACWQARQRDLTSLLLALFGGGMGITLGGPAIYDNITYRHTRVGGARQVRLSDLTFTLRAINRATWLLVTLLTLLLLVFWQLKL
ncbi:cobalamin biosynthesis protein [Alteromonas gilva]|uniref:Cobalamin biosynthesis protein n=1 Tax=Alteromonas gilva TaxID=2987522 RepID=A0ABT5L661_9ALTE|nr:cobalamin biosynthesis protein [Alteromonas gilva]MDC8832549.1 cobalamin biosynthesis protein [Alteromonas gilva]